VNPLRARLVLAVLCALCAACATWTPVRSSQAWTLYVKDGESIDVDRFDRTLRPAFAAVEEHMGPFRERVRIHAWEGSVNLAGDHAGVIESGDEDKAQNVPGIGPARVRAFHVRGGSLWFDSSGVFLGIAEVGTAVHELVHARVAEENQRLPLWFEEGLASFYGDGALFDGAWVVDGLACWPLRELRQQKLGDEELEQLLKLSAHDDYDARQNLLVHFVGWAVVFDLCCEEPGASWQQWLATFERGAKRQGRLAEVRERLARTLTPDCQAKWLARLSSGEPGQRFAAAKGLWKLRDVTVIDAMLDALDHEENAEVRAALALNSLLASNETRLGRARWGRMSNLVYPTLRTVHVDDEDEQKAISDLYESTRRWDSRRARSPQDALETLARYWEE
jgi:hypothetical protein